MARQNPTSASFKAQVSVTPPLSHSVLVVLILASMVPLIAGLYFLWYEKINTWVPFSIFFFLIAVVAIGWWKSQRLIDMGNVSQTTVSDQKGNQIITDSRMLESTNAIEHLGLLLQSMGVREPLPEPDGIVNNNGKILENSKQEANKMAEKINRQIKSDTDAFMQKMVRGNLEIAQNNPQLPDESFVEVLEHNQPAETPNS